MKKPILCRFGFHKWGKSKFMTNFRSNVLDYSKKCKRCGKIKKWVKTK